MYGTELNLHVNPMVYCRYGQSEGCIVLVQYEDGDIQDMDGGGGTVETEMATDERNVGAVESINAVCPLPEPPGLSPDSFIG